MNNRFKIIITNKKIYKEIELTPSIEKITVGTAVDSDVRLRGEYFFEALSLEFSYRNGSWGAVCSENLYFSTGDSRRLISLSFRHGDEYRVHYQNSGNEVLIIQFQLDFDHESKNYDREIYIAGSRELRIASSDQANIQIIDPNLQADALVLRREENQIVLYDMGCRYGVYVNGEKIQQKKALKEYDFFSVMGHSFFCKKEKLYTSKHTTIQIRGLAEKINNVSTTVLEYPKFNRSTRVQYEVPVKQIEIQQPTARPQLKKKSILMTLIPTLVMLVMTIVLRGFMGSGGSFVIYSVVSISMGMIMSVITYIQDKKEHEKEVVQREEKYREYIAEKEEKIKLSRQKETEVLHIIYESVLKNTDEVRKHGKRLFERSVKDKDFLHVYLGTGVKESTNPVSYNKQEFIDTEDPIAVLPEQIAEKYQFLENVPVFSDFRESNAIGIVGAKEYLKEMLKNITLDLGIRHFYKEVRLFYLLEQDYIRDFEWVQWLRNVDNEHLDIKNIVCDEESKNILLEDLYITLSNREVQEKEQQEAQDHYVVLVTKASDINLHPLSKFVKDAAKYGFTFVFLEEHEENLPQGCNEIIRIGNGSGSLVSAENGEQNVEFEYSVVPSDLAKEVALRLGAIYIDEVSLEEQLTKKITLFEMMGILSVEDLDLKKRWQEARVYKTMEAPIGIKGNKEIVYLNISDKQNGHGPHGLVAGTTGSGKSEILQTYILSLATLFHPYEVGFVIIDFKGGGMANQFAKLPHLIGTITNIDGREINRSLLSIKAELIKRQEMFSEANVNHINDYIKLFQAGKVEKAMPHLIMIVDEFAELKAEFPEFMKELISAARIGRTLGVHLILATQKPAGVVDSQIWSNSKFKLCLKVQTREDSNEVIKTPLAAEIIEPGRAYFQVGNNEIFELFQSAYSGDFVPEGTSEKIFSVYERNLWGKKKEVFSNRGQSEGKEGVTQLNAVVEYIDRFCRAERIEKLAGICLPSLPVMISTDELNYVVQDTAGYSIPIGVYDDPAMQIQAQVDIEISKDNIYVVGSAQSGKTNLLQTMAYNIMKKYTPEQVNIYMIDCGSMVLKIFENSHHVGGVVLPNEEEKCKNLFKLLNVMIGERKKAFSNLGIGNFTSYLEAGYTDMPLVVVLIDNLAAFKEYFPDQSEQLGVLTREGLGVGMSFVVTAAMSNALSYRHQANFGKKIVFNCNDTSEYSNLLGYSKVVPRAGAGSGLLVIDKRVLEWQAAIFGRSMREIERTQELREYIEQRNASCPRKAVPIPEVPEILKLEVEMIARPEVFRNPGMLPLGISFSTVQYSSVSMIQNGSLVLLGENEKKLRFVNLFLQAMAKNIIFHNAEAVIIDDKKSSLAEVKSYGFVKKYSSDLAESLADLNDFLEEIKTRKADEDKDQQLRILVINSAELLSHCYADRSLSSELTNAIKNANNMKMFILISQVENAAVSFNSSEVLRTLKEERKGIIFAPVTENKFYEITGRIKADTAFDNTMAYRFDNGGYDKIKLFE